MFWIALLPNPPQAEPLSPPHKPSPRAPLVLPIETLAWQALRFGPRVALLEEAVLLEAQGSLRLWGGKRRLLQELEQLDVAQGSLTLASAPTALAALALARHACGPDPQPRRHLNAAQLQAGLDTLALHTLSAAALHAPLLARLGCRSLGDLRALPRGGLQRRFDAALLDALDRAYGNKPENHLWVTLPETFAQRVEMPWHTDCADALLFAAKRMLLALQAWLAARRSGIRSFELQWLYEYRHRDEAAGGALTIATAQTSRDLAHWLRLLAEHLAHQPLAAPVCELRVLAAQTEPWSPGNTALLPDKAQQASDLLRFLERVGARLGADKVLSAQARSDHRAEHQALWREAVQALDGGLRRHDEPSRFDAGTDRQSEGHSPLPCWLLGQALALPLDARARPLYQGALKLLAGPERIEAGWWDCETSGPQDHRREAPSSPCGTLALRDYFLAQSEHAGLLWIYRERRPAPGAAQWFLHGIHG